MTSQPASVASVLGPVAAADLGVVLSHEHVFIENPSFVEPDEATLRARAEEPLHLENLGWVRWNWTSNRDNLRLDDELLASTELAAFRIAGGSTIVDPTVPGIGRDPEALARVARRSGVNIIMGCGRYVDGTHPSGHVGPIC